MAQSLDEELLERPSLPSRPYSLMERALGHIVFQGHSLRIGLELSICVLAYTAMQAYVPWSALGFDRHWGALYSWFTCCLTLLFLDLFVLCRSAHMFRRAYLLGLHGEFEKALSLITQIGPHSSRFIRLPRDLYHLYLAEIAAQQGKKEELEQELEQAKHCGAAPDRLLLQRIQLMRVIGEVDSCRDLISQVGRELGDNAELRVEELRTLINDRDDLWEAKRLARRIQKLPDMQHFSGESAHRLAAAFEAVTMLWTGEAEKGIDKLSFEIELMRRSMLYVDTLRPIFARLLLERGLYLATHKEPTPAVYDYTLSRALCTNEELSEIADSVRDELAERFAISLA